MDDYEYQNRIRDLEHRVNMLKIQVDSQDRRIKNLSNAIDLNSCAIAIISVGIMIMKIISYL